jgi:hypothetical protein
LGIVVTSTERPPHLLHLLKGADTWLSLIVASELLGHKGRANEVRLGEGKFGRCVRRHKNSLLEARGGFLDDKAPCENQQNDYHCTDER